MAERNYLAKTYEETSANGNIITKPGFQVNYLTNGKKNRPGTKLKDLRAIVLHWIGPYPKQNPVNTRTWWESESTYGSAHYVIGYDGLILQTLPDDEVAWHVGSTQPDPISKKVYTNFARKLFGEDKDKLGVPFSICAKALNNNYSIGIEMVPIAEDGTFSTDTLLAAEQLCADLITRKADLIRQTFEKMNAGKEVSFPGGVSILTTHNEITGWKNCPKRWTDYREEFVEFKKRVNKRLSGDLQCDESLIKINYPC